MPPKESSRQAAKRRRALRDGIWPDADEVVFPRAAGGWAQVPRTIPLIAALLDLLSKKDKPGRAYMTLWAYDYGDGFVELRDPMSLAFETGFMSNRAERTFIERMRKLRDLGFIRSSPVGLREFGFILLLDPHRQVAFLRASDKIKVPDRWWTAFKARCSAVGMSEPDIEAATSSILGR